jgi:hypothetical protein
MILGSILALILSIFTLPFALLPSGPALGINGYAQNVVNDGFFRHLGWVNNYLPLDQAVTAIGILLTLLGVMWTVRILLWVLTKFHILGGSDE